MKEYWRLSAVDIANLVRTREVSAVEVTQSALSRLDQVNPAINAVVIEMAEPALAAAAELDAKLAGGATPGLLCGVPVTVKVNIDQAGYATTNGLRLQQDLIATTDSPVVANLRRADAIIIGRTNTPAFSLRWFTRNLLHGQTFNPRNRGLTPGGSSGGAAAAVTAGIGAIGHGTDIGGSIRYPAYACGVHGIRPTLGRIPAANLSSPDRHIGGQLMAVSGPIARSIADLKLGLEAMSAANDADPWWVPVPLESTAIHKRAALCVAPEGLAVVPEVEQALRDAATLLSQAGWQVDEVDSPPLRKAAALQAVLWLAEFRRGAAETVYKENDPDATFIYTEMDSLCPPSDMNALMDALQQRVTLLRAWQQFLSEYPVLLCPVSADLPFQDQQDVESPESFKHIMEAQLTQLGIPLLGLPGLTVSTRMVGDTPVGVQLVSGRYQESVLLAAGAVIEQGGTPPSPVDPKM